MQVEGCIETQDRNVEVAGAVQTKSVYRQKKRTWSGERRQVSSGATWEREVMEV